MSGQRPTPAGPRLRPRPKAWVGALLPISVVQAGPLLLLWLLFRETLPILWFSLGLGTATIVFAIWKEYASHAAAPKFWTEDTGFPLNVRHVRTGELILQSETESLKQVDLRNANLAGANLSGVDLTGADLQGADLTGANLRSARLVRANLQGANLRGADLRSTDLNVANLCGANLSHACMGNAVLTRASLCGADLRGTNFVGRGVDLALWDRVLGPADFTGALWNSATRWPLRFDALNCGGVFESDGQAGLPIPHDGVVTRDAEFPIPAAQCRETNPELGEVITLGGHQ